jgi:hypothetical protein
MKGLFILSVTSYGAMSLGGFMDITSIPWCGGKYIFSSRDR